MVLILEILVAAVVVVANAFLGLDGDVSALLERAAESSRDQLRSSDEVRAAQSRSALYFCGGLGALLLGKLLAFSRARRRGGLEHVLSTPFLLPAVALLLSFGYRLQWGYGDPTRASRLLGLDFSSGVLLGGVVALAVLASPWDPLERLQPFRHLLWVAAMAAMLVLAIVGQEVGGAKINLRLPGGLLVQPVEGVKLALVLFLGLSLGRYAPQLRYHRVRRGIVQLPRPTLVLPAMAVVLGLVAGLFLIRDLGPSLVLVLTFLAFYYATTRSSAELLVVALVGGGALLWLALSPPFFVPDNVLTRIEMWRDPWLNGNAYGSQLASALWAFAAGGLLGQGVGEAPSGALPAGHTDLVLAHLAEVNGLQGLAGYLVVLGFIVLQGLWIAAQNRTPERALTAFGLSILLFAQTLVIFCGSTGALPLTGIVVPFLSFGRSSMVMFLVLVALLVRLAVDGRRREDTGDLFQLRGGIGAVAVVALVLVGLMALVALDRTWWSRRQATLRPVLVLGSDDTVFLRYDPRLKRIAARVKRGEIRDRRGVALAGTGDDGERLYPLGAAIGTLLGPVPGHVLAPSWALEGMLDDRLSGLPPPQDELAVWIERHDDRPQRQRDRILFTVPSETLRDGDLERARTMQARGTTLLFHRLKLRDYRPYLPFLYARGPAKSAAIADLAEDVESRSVGLTLDAELQSAASDALQAVTRNRGLAGAAVVLDVDSGRVLARAQWPDYDPASSEWRTAVLSAESRFLGSYGPWRDKTGVGGLYQTGSIFKVFTALAWARQGWETRGRSCGMEGVERFECLLTDKEGPYFTRPGWAEPIHDSHTQPDGVLEITEALEVSCNVFFGQLGLELGPQALRALVNDGVEVDAGRAWRPGAAGSRRLASTAFGQGAARMHPMEVARMVAAIGSGGVYRKCPPSMLAVEECEVRRLVEDGAELVPILAGMKKVIDSGTGRRFRSPRGVRVYGKTGTATDPGRADEVVYGIARNSRQLPHSWFIALAEPETARSCSTATRGRLATVVVIPRGGAGSGPALDVTERILQAAKDLGYFRS